MFVNINDIAYRIRRFPDEEPSYFDPYTYICYYGSELPPDIDTTRLVELPYTDELEIMKSFIDNCSDKQFIHAFRKEPLTIEVFHALKHKFCKSEEWLNFKDRCLFDQACTWCAKNGIAYTTKPLQDASTPAKMKNVILSADGPKKVYSVPAEVADDLEAYCIEFCDHWLWKSPDAKQYRVGQGVCYNEEDFIKYLNDYLFPNQRSVFVKTLYRDRFQGCVIPEEYKDCPQFNF